MRLLDIIILNLIKMHGKHYTKKTINYNLLSTDTYRLSSTSTVCYRSASIITDYYRLSIRV